MRCTAKSVPCFAQPEPVVVNCAWCMAVLLQACAFVAALVASGLPTTSATFVGFLPPKQGMLKMAGPRGLRLTQ